MKLKDSQFPRFRYSPQNCFTINRNQRMLNREHDLLSSFLDTKTTAFALENYTSEDMCALHPHARIYSNNENIEKNKFSCFPISNH